MKNLPLVSIIIRTKNEERWIKLCLNKIFEQTYKNFEIIIVDNYSSDKTLDKIKNYKIDKIIKVKKYLPGKSINIGIKKSKGKYIVILSAHCIPTNIYWLENYVKSMNSSNSKLAGIYGRQEPMNFSSENDQRDLFLVFGLDKKLQKKDSFFHNANSCIKRSIWNKIPFDEKVSNIEDRLWGQKIINKKFEILYQPKASVYHFHGIHQNNNSERLKNVIKIAEDHLKLSKGKIDPSKLNIIAVIPIKGNSIKVKNDYLIKTTINYLKKTKYIKKIIVSTDNLNTKKISLKYGAEVPFIRLKEFSKPDTNLETVQQYTLKQLEKRKIYPDLFLHLEETYPFREKNLIDLMIERLVSEGLDSIVAAKREVNWVWKDKKDNNFIRIDSGDRPREFQEKSMIGYHGIACLTYPEFVRKGKLLGDNVGLYEIKNQISFIEVRDKDSISLAKNLSKLF